MELINHSFGFYGVTFFGIILIRYFLVAGGTYWFFYSTLRQSFLDKSLINDITCCVCMGFTHLGLMFIHIMGFTHLLE